MSIDLDALVDSLTLGHENCERPSCLFATSADAITALRARVAQQQRVIEELHQCLLWHYDAGHSNTLGGFRLKLDQSALRKASGMLSGDAAQSKVIEAADAMRHVFPADPETDYRHGGIVFIYDRERVALAALDKEEGK